MSSILPSILAVASDGVETSYLVLLIATFVIIGVVSVYILLKLFAGQR